MLKIVKIPSERIAELRELRDKLNAVKLEWGDLKDQTRKELGVELNAEFDDQLENVVSRGPSLILRGSK